MRSVYGSSAHTLTEVIEGLMILQGNVKQNHYMQYLLHAQEAWKKLLRTTIWAVKPKVLDVVDGKITMPNDLMRLLSLSVVDCDGNRRPLGYNPNINTLSLHTVKGKCSCTTCNGVGTLCGVVDMIQLRTETVSINDHDYTRRIWYRKNERGDLQQVTENPVYDQDGDSVIMHTIREAVCELETTETGCIKATPTNRRRILDCCGSYIFVDCPALREDGCISDCDVSPKLPPLAVTPYSNDYGSWNWDAEASDVVHLRNVNASKVIATYQTNGKCPGEELMVPDYAVEPLRKQIINGQTYYNNAASKGDKEFARGEAERERMALLKYFNPIRISTFTLLHGQIAQW